MIELTIESDSASMLLAGASSRVSDLSMPLRELLEDVLAQSRTRFLTKGPGPDGEIWDAPSPKTRYVGGESLMVRSEALLDSLSEGAQGNVFEVSATAGVVGTEIPYAMFQQEGTSRGIPPRPFLGWADESIDTYIVRIGEWVIDGE